MLAAGDTNQFAVSDWVFEQGRFVKKGNRLLILLFLSHHAFYREINPEEAPVGQVMKAYSSIAAICRGTGGLADMTVRRALWSLQADYGYLLRTPRTEGGRQTAHVIRVFWTQEFDEMRLAHHQHGTALPKQFRLSPEELKTQARLRSPGFKLLKGGLEGD